MAQAVGNVDSLPAEVLHLVVSRLQSKSKNNLLRTSRAFRDAVLLGAKSIKLYFRRGEQLSGMAAHQPLLARACSAAKPGVALTLAASRSPTCHKLLLDGLLEPYQDQGLSNVYVLTLHGWLASQALGGESFIVGYAFPNLRTLRLEMCSLDGAACLASLLACPQLKMLKLQHCTMSASAIAALPMLRRLPQLRDLIWFEPQPYQSPMSDISSTLANLAKVTQLTYLGFGSNRTATNALLAVAAHMAQLDYIDVGPTMYPARDSRDASKLTPPTLTWSLLDTASLSQLFTTCSALTQLSLEGTVLDQAGLDLLLGHPHITDVTFLGIAATESRVDSPCSWRALWLPDEVDIRTVAYVPLHSLKEPFFVGALLLPPDVPSDQLPPLLLQATTRMAEHRHLFVADNFKHVFLTDHITGLLSGIKVEWVPGGVQQGFQQNTRAALLAALEPLTAVPSVEALSFEFRCNNASGDPPRLEFGRSELLALSRSWGSRITTLGFQGVALADGFFPALEAAFPHLRRLNLLDPGPQACTSTGRLMAFSHTITHPLIIRLPQGPYQECKALMEEFWPPEGPRPKVTFELQ